MSNNENIGNERSFICLLLQDISLVDLWMSDGPGDDCFDDEHLPLLWAIKVAFSENSLLTRRRLTDFLKEKRYKKTDIISYESLFNRILLNISGVTKDDYVYLAKKITESYVTQSTIESMSHYQTLLKENGGIVATRNLFESLRSLVEDQRQEKRAVYEDVYYYAPEYIKELRRKAEEGDKRIITCGIKEIDYAMVVGFAPGTLTLFCGDVGGFKSSMMLNVAVNIWKNQNKNVLVIPLEMPREKWFQRMYSRELRIPFDRMEHASSLTEDEWNSLENEYKKWGEYEGKFYIMEAPERVPVSYIRREIDKHLEIFKPDLVVIDYIANLLPENDRHAGRNDLEIGEMLKDLRQMGKPGGMGIHNEGFSIISGAQLGRDALKRIRKSGVLKGSFHSEDLRGSQEYAADADNIFAQMKDDQNSSQLYEYCVKTRYGRGIFENGTIRTVLNVVGDIGLIESKDNQWIDDMNKKDILNKVDGIGGESDTSENDNYISDTDTPWGEEQGNDIDEDILS